MVRTELMLESVRLLVLVSLFILINCAGANCEEITCPLQLFKSD